MFGAQLANAGFQTVVVRGRAEQPCYLLVQGGKCEMLKADFLWGKDTWETQSILKRHLEDEDLEIMTIGPAGEGLVRYACILDRARARRGEDRDGGGDGLQEPQGHRGQEGRERDRDQRSRAGSDQTLSSKNPGRSPLSPLFQTEQYVPDFLGQ